MFVNRMTVQVTIKCGECPRTGTAHAELVPAPFEDADELQLGRVLPPTDWKQVQVDAARHELFCPLCAREAL